MNKQHKEELHLGENELADWVDKKLGHLKPYTSQIILAVVLVFAAFVAITYFVNARRTAYADQWRELSLANTDLLLNQNTDSLLNLAEDFPNQKAAMWSLQIAGDADLQQGLTQLSYDREGGFAIIKRARDNLQKVVDASNSLKSAGLQQRALFSLAYACESLGEFKEAQTYYQQLIDESPNAAFAEPARRGLARASNPELIALFDTFKNFKELGDIAPGPNVPTLPNIEFPDLDVEPIGGQPEVGGGDFEGDGKTASTANGEIKEPTTPAAPAGEDQKNSLESGSTEKTPTTEPAGGESPAEKDKSKDGGDKSQSPDESDN